jgi:prepilin-type N-terminal cleavage/methylation domain-containing protein
MCAAMGSGIHQNRNRGFTLLEVLIGVAIVAILLAIGIPAITVIRANLRMTELDAAARRSTPPRRTG